MCVLCHCCGAACESCSCFLVSRLCQTFGFGVTVLGACPTIDALRAELTTANQLWLISTSSAHLSDAHIDFIAEEWRNGLALYVFGDNSPYFVDANRLLKVRGCGRVLCYYVALRGSLFGDVGRRVGLG
jgi:hypothetical protein